MSGKKEVIVEDIKESILNRGLLTVVK